MVSSAGGFMFGGFQRFVASFRVAGVALCDIQTRFITCRKSFCVAGAILLRRFPKMRGSFSGRRSTLDGSIVILRGRRSTLDVSCWVFFANRIGRAASSGDKVQMPWQAWHFVRCTENWRKPRTKHWFWGSKCRGSSKTRRKTSILRLQSVKIGGSLARNARFGAPTCLVSRHWFYGGFAVSMGEAAKHVLSACFKVWKLEEVSHKMLVLVLQRVSFRVSSFPVASPCLSGQLQNLSFSKVSKQVVMSFCVAGVALCDIPTSLITCRKCLWFSRHVAVSIGEAAKPLLSKVSTQVVMSFCVAGMALCDIPTLHSTLHTLHFPLHTPHSTLYTLHSTLYTLHFTLLTPLHYILHSTHTTLLTPHSTLYTPHFTLHTLHSTLLTLHSALHTPHSTLYTLHTPPTPLSTPHSTLYTPHSTL